MVGVSPGDVEKGLASALVALHAATLPAARLREALVLADAAQLKNIKTTFETLNASKMVRADCLQTLPKRSVGTPFRMIGSIVWTFPNHASGTNRAQTT